jgi:endonuclease/exonuclease/phosphatase family metal-dependent hydrolase
MQVYSVHLNWSFHQSTVRATQLAEVCARPPPSEPVGIFRFEHFHPYFTLCETPKRPEYYHAGSAQVCKFVQSTRKESSPCPPILCGDLNATPDSDEIRALLGDHAPPRPGAATC